METELFSRLCKKEVISIHCGKKIGYPKDIVVDLCSGKLLFLIVPCKSAFSLFEGKNCIKIPVCDIEKIGEDVIWVCTKE